MTLGEATDLKSKNLPDGQEWHASTITPESITEYASQISSTVRGPSRESVSSVSLSDSTTGPAINFEQRIHDAQAADTLEERGRTFTRAPRYENPLARAESRAGRADAVIELNSTSIGRRMSRSNTFFEDPTDPCAVLDDSLLEPCPHVLRCANVSEVLSDPPEESSDPLFVGSDHASFDAEKINSSNSPSLGTPTADLCQMGPPGGVASQLPPEILQEIYYNLLPSDFNSARHTCRSWFINSLEPFILDEMLQRGGFASSLQHDLTTSHITLPSQSTVNEEWLISKRLARECALGPDWKGNGIPKSEGHNNSAFSKVGSVDFTEVCVPNLLTKSSGTLFTVSSCGNFLMAANGCLLYVYELNKTLGIGHDPGSLRPITSIICPARILACSMDTSSRRYAVAILLDGRKGMVCEISLFKKKTKDRNIASVELQGSLSNASKEPNETSALDQVSLCNSAQSKSQPFVFPGIASTRLRDDPQWQDVLIGETTHSAHTSRPSSRQGSMAHLEDLKQIRPAPRPTASLFATASRSRYIMPIENGPRSFYRNICSEDDPPRSVAICPQRRCVAFGCSSGIELHWVDALTGQDLNRWFPLTSPSDFLFFLPPRKSVDSAKKLRLISSAARPSERAAIATRAFGGRSRSSHFWQRLVWGNNHAYSSDRSTRATDRSPRTISSSSGISNIGRPNRRPDRSDHFRAVPLSDGYHILFTDPASGTLCLGSDAPIGGPTKLLRKIWFEDPLGEGSPSIYASGSDLTRGVRVVAAFGNGAEQSVWLYSVPSDIFNANQNAPSVFNGAVFSNPEPSRQNNTAWCSWWPKNGAQEWLNRTGDYVPGLSQHSVWPVKIRGQEIGKCTGVVDLAIDSGPSMTIWAFGKDGISTVWKINNGRGGTVKESIVVRDGTIREKDSEGDLQMIDADAVVGSFDGASSSPSIDASTSRKRRRRPSDDGSGGSDSEEDEAGFAWRYVETQRLSRCGSTGVETDFVTRVSIQIR